MLRVSVANFVLDGPPRPCPGREEHYFVLHRLLRIDRLAWGEQHFFLRRSSSLGLCPDEVDEMLSIRSIFMRRLSQSFDRNGALLDILPGRRASVIGLWVLLPIHLLFPLFLLAALCWPAFSSLDILLHLLSQESVDLALQLCVLGSQSA
jgi:hypothetical protein